VARTEAELNAMRGTAKVDVDRDFLGNSIATALQAAFSATGLQKVGDLLTSAFGSHHDHRRRRGVHRAGRRRQPGGGRVALVPAGIAAIAAPAAVVAIGVHGIGDAFKAIDTGNADKIAAAMANLAPSARDFVTQVHALGPAWTDLRLDVQQSLFAGVGTAVTNLANVALPVLHTGLTGIASALNEGLLATMTALQGRARTSPPCSPTSPGRCKMASGAAGPLMEAFGTLGAVGSQFLPVLAQGFVNVATAFNNWVQRIADSGQLVVIIQNAINVLKQLGELAVNVAGVVTGIFTAALPYGTILLDLLIKTTGALSTFIHSADGQAALGSFFSGLTVALGTILPALETLVQAVVVNVLPAIGQFAAALAPIAGTLLVQLAAVLNQVGQILPPVATVMAALASAMAPLIPVIGTLITTLLPPLVQFFGQLAPIIGQVATIIGGALLQAAAAVAPILPQLGDAFIHILNALLPLVPPLLQIALQLLPPLLSVASALVPIVTGLVDVFAPLLQTFLKIVDATVLPVLVTLINGFAAGLKVLAGFLGPLAPILQAIAIAIGVWTAAQWLLNIALDANPIGIIILAIGALITAIGLIATHMDQIRAVWNAAWAAIKDFFEATWNAIRDFFVSVWTAIVNWFNGVIASFVSTWQGVWTGIRDFFVGIWNAISSFAQTIWNAIASFFAGAWNAFTTAWTNFWNAIFSFFQGLWNGLVAWIQGVWNNLASWFSGVWNAFTTAWTNFWNAIFSFFQGLWNSLVAWIAGCLEQPGLLVLRGLGGPSPTPGTLSGMRSSRSSRASGTASQLRAGQPGTASPASSPAPGTFTSAWNAFWDRSARSSTTSGTASRTSPDRLERHQGDHRQAPINFVIGTILNGGLFKAWNAVNDFLHLPFHINDLPTITRLLPRRLHRRGTACSAPTARTTRPVWCTPRSSCSPPTRWTTPVARTPCTRWPASSTPATPWAGWSASRHSDPQPHLNSYVVPPDHRPPGVPVPGRPVGRAGRGGAGRRWVRRARARLLLRRRRQTA
jgi:phage-related protein